MTVERLTATAAITAMQLREKKMEGNKVTESSKRGEAAAPSRCSGIQIRAFRYLRNQIDVACL
jgi:hypothetical protein